MRRLPPPPCPVYVRPPLQLAPVPCTAVQVKLSPVNPDTMQAPLPAAACFAAEEGQRCLFYSSAGVLVGTLHADQALWLWQRFRGSDWQHFVLEVCALLTRRQFTRQLETRFVPKLKARAALLTLHDLVRSSTERFSSPLSASEHGVTTFFYSRDEEDTLLGATHDAFRWQWRGASVALPPRSTATSKPSERLLQPAAVRWAISSAASTTDAVLTALVVSATDPAFPRSGAGLLKHPMVWTLGRAASGRICAGAVLGLGWLVGGPGGPAYCLPPVATCCAAPGRLCLQWLRRHEGEAVQAIHQGWLCAARRSSVPPPFGDATAHQRARRELRHAWSLRGTPMSRCDQTGYTSLWCVDIDVPLFVVTTVRLPRRQASDSGSRVPRHTGAMG
jgi:hypothetical protein